MASLESVCSTAVPGTVPYKACECQKTVNKFKTTFDAYKKAHEEWLAKKALWEKDNLALAAWQNQITACKAEKSAYSLCGGNCDSSLYYEAGSSTHLFHQDRVCNVDDAKNTQRCINRYGAEPLNPNGERSPRAPTPPSNNQIQCCSQVLLNVNMQKDPTNLSQQCSAGISNILSTGEREDIGDVMTPSPSETPTPAPTTWINSMMTRESMMWWVPAAIVIVVLIVMAFQSRDEQTMDYGSYGAY